MTSQPDAIASGEPAPRTTRGIFADPPTWAAAAVLAIAIGAVYYRSLAVPFIFDDVVGIKANESIYSLWPLVGSMNHRGPLNPAPDTPLSGRPLVSLSFALNYAVGGDNPAGYHAVNVAIHFIAALLLFAIVRRTLRLPFFAGRFDTFTGWLALAVALVWALHPLQTEAVIYLTQRTELMMAMFYLATLYCSLRYWLVFPLPIEEGQDERKSMSNPWQRTTWLASAFVSCLLGMASKEVMVSAPIMVLLFERTFIAGSLVKSLRRSWPLYVALVSTWLLLVALNFGGPRGNSAGFGFGPPLISWWLTQSQMVLIYLKLVVWPWPLLIHYQLPYLKTFADAWMYAIPVALLGLTTLALLWQNKPLGFLGFWVFAILAPTSAVPILTEMGAERRMYLPLAVFVVLVVVAGYALAQKLCQSAARLQVTPFGSNPPGAVTVIAALVAALGLGIVSAQRVPAYLDQLSLWSDVLHYQPNNYLAYTSRGMVLTGLGRRTEAIDDLHRAIALKPDHPVALNNLGLALQQADQEAKAIDVIQSALKLDPDYPEAHDNLAHMLADVGRFPEAIEHLQHILRLHPGDAVAHNNLANTLSRAGHLPEAIDEFQAAIALKGDDPHLHSNMAGVLTQMGRYQEAIDHCQQALRLCADCFDAHHNLGTAFLHAGLMPQAIVELRAALAVKPDDPTALNTLGAALLQVGQYPEAEEHIERALQLRPKYAVAHNNLGQALARTGKIPQALEQFRLATEQDQHFAGAQISWGLVLFAQDNFKESIGHFEKAIQLGADQPDVHNNLGDAYRKSGDTTRAIEQYEIAVRQNPAYMLAYANLAQTLALVDRSKEALTVSEKAMEVARSTGQQDALEQFEEWLKHYQTELRRAADAATPAQPAPTRP